MKKLLIGAIIGGILVFGWQTLSWTMLHLHKNEMMQAKNQDSIINYLSSQLTEEGQYYIPRENDNASSKEMHEFQEKMAGKPWATVSYHKAFKMDMTMGMIRGILSAMISVFFVCWVLMKQSPTSFLTTFISCVLIGIAGYLFIPYAGHIWMQNYGTMQNLIDVFLSWGLCGIWLGWWLNKK
jgi:Phr family secreted Rap phosphatase inhibitor